MAPDMTSWECHKVSLPLLIVSLNLAFLIHMIISLMLSQCGHKGNWIQIPSCGNMISVFLKEVRCDHKRCGKCDKLSELAKEADLEKGDEGERKKKGLRAWFLRSG